MEPEEYTQVLVRRDGTYLITGGLGALGLRVANWLAEQGAGTIALLRGVHRRTKASRLLTKFERRAQRSSCCVGMWRTPSRCGGALAQLPADCPPLRGVVHAAGVLADGILTEMTLDQLDRAMAPKVRGAWNLHVATRELPLDFFVLFSSVASVLGSPGQANYAAGNAYLDALAHARRREGLPATAINWGPWAGSGMAAEAGRDESVKSRGMALIEPQDGLDVLGKLMKSGAPQVAVMNAQWADMLKLLGSRRPALLAEIAAEVQESGGDVTASRVDHAFRQQLLAADGATRQTLVQEYIRQELARIMGIEPASLETNQPLSTFGLDSLLALELKNNLESRLDFTLPMAKLMEGPSIESLAAETARLVAGDAAEKSGVGATADAVNERAGLDAAVATARNRQPPAAHLAAGTRRRRSVLRRFGAATGRRPARVCIPSAGPRPGVAAAFVDRGNDRRLPACTPQVAASGAVLFGRLVDRRRIRVRAGRGAGAGRRGGGPDGPLGFAPARRSATMWTWKMMRDSSATS